MKDIRYYSLLGHNTFGIDARCRRFIEFSSEEELHSILPTLTDADAPYLILGAGSNLLLTKDYDGTVIHSALRGWTYRAEGDLIYMRCASGENWDEIVAQSVAHGWSGMENLSLIPGEVGASAVQNIGAYGAEAKDIIESIEAVELATGKNIVFAAKDCGYGYRHSHFKSIWQERYLITHVTYRLRTTFTPQLDYGNIREELRKKGISSPTLAQMRETIIEIRQAKLPDPAVEGNAGSFFTNPVVPRAQYERLASQHPSMPHYSVDDEHEKIPAAWLIEQCGWKGRSLGRAGVHHRQPLVLVNRGGASGSEILHLCREIQNDVQKHFGINLLPEVNIR